MIQPGQSKALLIQVPNPVYHSLAAGEWRQGDPEFIASEVQYAGPADELADQRTDAHRRVRLSEGRAEVLDQVEGPMAQPSHHLQAGHCLRRESGGHRLALFALSIGLAEEMIGLGQALPGQMVVQFGETVLMVLPALIV